MLGVWKGRWGAESARVPAHTQEEGDGDGEGDGGDQAGRYRDAHGKPTADAPWLLGTTAEIETLRPRSPVRQPTTAAGFGGGGGDDGQAAQASTHEESENLEVEGDDKPDDF
jgi:hypothetical protein